MSKGFLFPSSPSDPPAKAADHLWAKFEYVKGDGRQESIPVHTANVLAVYIQLRERFEPLLQEGEEFWRDLYIALLFHDAGKFVLNFQEENRQSAEGKPRDWDRYIRHEFISCLLLLGDYSILCADRPQALFAVAAHHKPLHKGIFYEDKTSVDNKKLDYRTDDLATIEKWLSSRLEAIGVNWSFCGRARSELREAECERLEDARRYFTRTAFGKTTGGKCLLGDLIQGDGPQNRLSYAYTLGLLHACDWAGSAKRPPNPPLSYTEADIGRPLREKFADFTWRTFQEESAAARGNVLAIAPTGSGKTEAALLWAASRPPGARIIYCLPTRVTSNAIYQRIKKLFPANEARSEPVGVVHSGAKNYRIIEDPENYDDREYLTDKSFGREITVCTIDQLLTMGFNLGHWQMKTLYATQAAIIIDEIHLYEPYTLALIVQTIDYLQRYCGATFYIMTATLPQKLQSLLTGVLHDVTVIEDQERATQARNSWEYVDATWGQLLGERLQQDIEAGKKVLVVRNTVDDCVRTYEQMKGYAVPGARCCLHSRFTTVDRLAKEERVIQLGEQEPFLLVSTQVVEVSLDIDFDVLYSENAPIDALVQRAGRVNRKNKKESQSTRIIVFAASDSSRKMYEKEVESLLDRTADQLRQRQLTLIQESEMIRMVDAVYADYEVTQTEGYRRGLTRYQEVQTFFDFILDNDQSEEEKATTREGIDTVNVIPEQFREELKGEKLAKKSQYQVALRPDQLRRLPKPEPDDTYDFLVYVHSPYSSETGLYIPPWQEVTEQRGTNPTDFA
jgi:CRISPR-associated endonuclease/helicase Cas3